MSLSKIAKVLTIASVLIMSSSSLFAQSAQGIQNVEIHGYMQNRFYANPDNGAKFSVNRVSMQATGKIDTDKTAYVEIYFNPTSTSPTYVESAYFDMPLGDGKIRFGKGRQQNFGMVPSAGNRKTTQYGSVLETFTADRIIGMQYIYKKNGIDSGASLYSDLRLGKRGIGDFEGSVATNLVNHFCDRDVSTDASGKMAGSVKLGIAKKYFQAHVSGAVGGLNKKDLVDINSAYDMDDNTNTDHSKYGLDAAYASGPLYFAAEYYRGSFSFLNIDGYNLTAGYQPAGQRRYYVRYLALNNNRMPNDNTLTWDTKQWLIGFVQPIAKGVWAEINYEKNTETGNLNNDLLFLEVYTGF